MELITIFLIAVGLAMDAFAVSVTNGISVPCFRQEDAARQGIYFGGFQFIMPVIGWYLGSSVKNYIEAVDHWIAFLLLVIIGGNMILESIQKKEEKSICQCGGMSAKCLILQAIATSIDALAVGISFALLDVNILFASVVIGIVAFLFSFLGGVLGKGLGGFLEKKAEFLGGVVLIVIGIKILTEHLFY